MLKGSRARRGCKMKFQQPKSGARSQFARPVLIAIFHDITILHVIGTSSQRKTLLYVTILLICYIFITLAYFIRTTLLFFIYLTNITG